MTREDEGTYARVNIELASACQSLSKAKELVAKEIVYLSIFIDQ